MGIARKNRHVGEGAGAMHPRPEGELLAVVGAVEKPLVLVLDQVQDPHNLGACLRSADAAGAHAVIAPKRQSAPLSETVRRVSCGAADHIPYFQVTNLARTLGELKEAGLWLVGTADEAGRDIYEVDLSGPTALVMGAEGDGLRRLTAECCDFLVGIPMGGHVPCLNVSVAAGVCLFEAVRQRRELGVSARINRA